MLNECFEADRTLKVGDEGSFSVLVCRLGDDIPTGPSFMLYDTFMRGNLFEVFLNGVPPDCRVALGECVAVDHLTRSPE
jgi:hypothetical protein